MDFSISEFGNRGFSQKSITQWQTVDPDETGRHEPFHLNLYSLQRYLYWSVGIKVLSRLLSLF